MEQLTKDELLAKAKETYKEGTEVICLHSGTKKTIGKYKPHSFADNNDIWIGSKPSLSIKIYDSLRGGKWAEIISTPRQHDRYIVPFDLFGGNLKKGTIIKLNVGKDFETGIETWDSGNGENWILPIEIVENWEKHYPEQTEQTTKPDYTKVVELIEGEIITREEYCKKRALEGDYSLANNHNQIKIALNDLLTKIKAL